MLIWSRIIGSPIVVLKVPFWIGHATWNYIYSPFKVENAFSPISTKEWSLNLTFSILKRKCIFNDVNASPLVYNFCFSMISTLFYLKGLYCVCETSSIYLQMYSSNMGIHVLFPTSNLKRLINVLQISWREKTSSFLTQRFKLYYSKWFNHFWSWHNLICSTQY